MGVKHGASPTIVGNLVHGSPGGGVLAKVGVRQGKHPIDRATPPTIRDNVVLANGTARPGIGCEGAGSREKPVRSVGNRVFDAKGVGIGVVSKGVAVIEENLVVRSGRIRHRQGARVLDMLGNAADSDRDPGSS